VEAEGCTSGRLGSWPAVRATGEAIVRDLKLKVVGEGLAHQFPPPSGVTMMYLLTESHLTCPTYPEYGIATFSLSCCRPRPRWDWEGQLGAFLGAARVTVRCLSRGAVAEPEPATSAR